jgi:hypothetical protein
MKIEHLALTGLLLVGLAACDHSKPKPISNNITKTVVTVNGKKDSVINNPKRTTVTPRFRNLVLNACFKLYKKPIVIKKSPPWFLSKKLFTT